MADGTDNGFATYMSGADALLWTIERDPTLRSTVAVVALLDRPPDMDALRARLRDGVGAVPRLRQRVHEIPGRLAPPRWTHDGELDLDYHVRRVALPSGAGMGELFELAASLAMTAFDRSRPLWELTVVEGLPGGGAALVQKLHHSLSDGEGGVRLTMQLLDLTRDATPAAPPPPPPPPLERLDPRALLAEQVRMGLGVAGRAARGLLGAGTSAAASGLRDPLGSARGALGMAGSVARLLAPVGAPLSPVMRHRGLSWRYGTIEVPLGDLRLAARAAEGSVNDAYLAAVAGGLRRYHTEHGVDVPELRVTMPVSFRTASDPAGGNRFAPLRFRLPVDVADPAARVREVRRRSRAAQDEPAVGITEPVSASLYRLPPVLSTALFGSMLKGVDVVATNVAGSPVPLYLAGAEILRTYAFAPPAGAAVNVALLSYGATAFVGVVTDRAAVPRGDELVAALRHGFDEVLALAPRRTPAPAGRNGH